MRKLLALCAGAVLAVAGLAGTATPASAAVHQLPEPVSSGGERPKSISIECSLEGHAEYSKAITAKARSVQVTVEASVSCNAESGTSGAEIVFTGEGILSCTDGYVKGFGAIDWGLGTSFFEGASSHSARADGSVAISFEGTVKYGLYADANVSASLTVSAETVALCKAGEAAASADLTGSIKVVSD